MSSLSIIVLAALVVTNVAIPAGTEQPEEAADSIHAVTVVADRGVVVSRTDTVGASTSLSVAEALSSVPGLLIMDNGGASGLKTVSLRGLGSAHTAIYLDGVRVGNVQSGQTDLGMFDSESLSGIIVDYAQNSLSLVSAKPTFRGRPVAGTVKFRGGSFCTYEPWGRLDFRLTDAVSMSATAGGIISKGNFIYGDNNERRDNNDIRQIRGGLDFRGVTAGGDWHLKAWCSASERGTPGSVSWPSTDRQKDVNSLVQTLIRKRFSPLYHLSVSAKVSYDILNYLSEWGDSRYGQTEVQINSSHRFNVTDWFDASVAADFLWDGLKSTGYDSSRSNVTAAVSASFHPGNFKADVAIEYSGIFDGDGTDRHVFSPSVDVRWEAFKGFYLAAFGRRSNRFPTFNELYYPAFGNPELKAEDAWLTDFGIGYDCTPVEGLKFAAKADAFFNYLTDKIISAPTEEDPNVWLPFNIGVVMAAGTEIQAGISYADAGWTVGFTSRYTFQDAVDRTPGSTTEGVRIPYLARHSVYLDANASFRGWCLDLDWLWRGGRRDSLGEMPDFHTLNLTAGKDFLLPGNLVLGLKFLARNITGCRYEISTGYPMPSRAFYGEIFLKF